MCLIKINQIIPKRKIINEKIILPIESLISVRLNINYTRYLHVICSGQLLWLLSLNVPWISIRYWQMTACCSCSCHPVESTAVSDALKPLLLLQIHSGNIVSNANRHPNRANKKIKIKKEKISKTFLISLNVKVWSWARIIVVGKVNFAQHCIFN